MSTQTDVDEHVAETVTVDIKQQEENEPKSSKYQLNPNQISEDEVKNAMDDNFNEQKRNNEENEPMLILNKNDNFNEQKRKNDEIEERPKISHNMEHEIELADVKKQSNRDHRKEMIEIREAQDQDDFKSFFDSLELIADKNIKDYIEKFKANGFDSYSALLRCQNKFDKQFLQEIGVEILADQLILLVELKNITTADKFRLSYFLKKAEPGEYKVIYNKGAACYLQSESKTVIPVGTIVTVAEFKDGRCRITSPTSGWISTHTNYAANDNIPIIKKEPKKILTKTTSENESANADEEKNEAKTASEVVSKIFIQKNEIEVKTDFLQYLECLDLTGDIELYYNKLLQHGFDELTKFWKAEDVLDKQDLKYIGINNIGDQIKILAIQRDEDSVFANKFNKYRKNTLNPMHDISNIYYIYYDDKISGPHTMNEIVTMYVYKQIKPGKNLYISLSEDGDNEWFKLPILAPDSIRDDEDKKLLKKIEYNCPELYRNLVENVSKQKLQQVESPPKKRPKEEESKRSSFMVSVRRIFGKILLFILLFVTIIHIIILAPIGIAMQCCFSKINHAKIRASTQRIAIFTFCDGLSWVFMFIGLMILPLFAVWVMLSQFDFYDEIQSWMIAYIVWGTSSFTLLVIFVVALRLEEQKSERLINVSKNIIFYIVGVDLGKLDVIDIIDRSGFFELIKGDFASIVLMMLPPCASLLPAAIVGFIANFVLEEKFFFKCDREIVNEDICFNTSYGCCEVISSHNIENTYAFIGGLASNILATWAIIRFSGYLLVNANANFSVYANRRINK
eukprot:221482_1